MAYMAEVEENQFEIMASLNSMNINIDRLQTHIESFDAKLTNLTDSVNKLTISKVDGGSDHVQAAVNAELTAFRLPNINFPIFAGTNPRAWTNKCDRFFELFTVPETQKVLFASFYLEGHAETWFRLHYESKQRALEWPTFVEDICARFGLSRMEEFKGLRQSTTVLAYIEKFEEVLADVIWEPWFDSQFLVASFIGGLKGKIRSCVQMLHPTTFAEAANIALLEDAELKPRF